MIQSIKDLSAVKTTTEQILKLSSIFFPSFVRLSFVRFFVASFKTRYWKLRGIIIDFNEFARRYNGRTYVCELCVRA